MPEFQDFVSELDDIGVLINGREIFIATGVVESKFCLQRDGNFVCKVHFIEFF